MIEFLVVAGVGASGIAASLTLGILAWRGRGEALSAMKATNAANDGKLEAERHADQWGRDKLDADTKAAAATKELEITKSELERVRLDLAAERAEKGKLYAKLAALGAPVGDVLVDNALDGLPPDKNR
jgi:hypothetical protein